MADQTHSKEFQNFSKTVFGELLITSTSTRFLFYSPAFFGFGSGHGSPVRGDRRAASVARAAARHRAVGGGEGALEIVGRLVGDGVGAYEGVALGD